MVATPQPVGHGLVVFEDADARVDDEQHQIGLLHGGLDLAADLVVEVAASRHPTAGVDHPERYAEPFGFELLAVAGDAGTVLDDGLLFTEDTVEQGALAHVGAAHDHEGGERGGFHGTHDAVSNAVRRAMPSVAMISTGRGSSSTVTPSRKRPSSERHTSGTR